MKKKIISTLLIISLVFSFNFSSVFALTTENGEAAKITCNLDDEGTLTVSGNGAMEDYFYDSPWAENGDIKKIVIEEGITRIGNMAFRDCTNLTEIVIPSTLTALGDQSFAGTALTSVEIPNTMTDLGYCVFVGCASLAEFNVAEDHPTLSAVDGVLFNKEKTTLIHYPAGKEGNEYDVSEGVTEIYHYAFNKCLGLEKVTFPSTLTTIGDEAFFGCLGLTAIDVPEGVVEIGGGAFQECEGLVDISLPKTLRFLNGHAFDNSGYYLDEENWDNEILYIDSILVVGERWDENYNWYKPSGDIVIKDGTTMIAGDSFLGNGDLTSVTFPNTLEHICEGAFYGCSNLENIALPSSLRTLDDLAFGSCTNLAEVTMGSYLEFIGYSVFLDTAYVANAYKYTNGVLYNNHNLICTDEVIAANYVIEEGTKVIASEAFKGRSNMTSVVIPESVEYIGEHAFSACSSLKNVEIPSTVKKIYDNAFGYNYYYDGNLDRDVLEKYDDFSISGYTETEAHRYAIEHDIPFNDLAGCQHNGEIEIVGKVEVGCTTDGYTGDKKCVDCGKIIEVGEVVACEGMHNEVGYDYVAPTCTEVGYQFGCYCADCGVVTIPREELPATGHRESTLNPVEPTCTEPGLSEGTACSVCREILVPQEIRPANGHNKGIKIPGTTATCNEPGLTDGYACTTCGTVVVKQEQIPATNHEYETKVTAPTCLADGYTTYTCIGCDDSYMDDFTNATGHAWDEGTVTIKPTCDAMGEMTYQCKNAGCKEIKQENIKKTAHTPVTTTTKATTSEVGKIVTACKTCGEIFSTETIAKISTVKLSYTQKVYTGSTIKAPTLTVKDSKGNTLDKGTDFDVSGLTGKKAVGKYAVKITFKGSYSGTKTLYFNIVPKKVSSATATLNSADTTSGYDDIKFSWKKSTGASGYLVYYKKASASKYTLLKSTTGTSVTKKNLSDGVKYTFKVIPYYKKSGSTTKYYAEAQYKTASVYTLKKVANVKVSKSGTKVKVKWSNIQGETGYQISKSTKKAKTGTITTYKTTSGTYKNITATKGKTYYYKVRAYKVVNGKKVYGPWSAVKSFKRK